MRTTLPVLLSYSLTLLLACSSETPPPPAGTGAQGQSPPTSQTMRTNQLAAQDLPIGDRADFAAAERGRIASEDRVLIQREDGSVLWDTAAYGFLEDDAPASVHPSLWRQAQLNNRHGLFEVVDGIYQVRGYDLSNMSLIRGRSGWILVDPLTSKETARAALAFARQHLGNDPIVAVILTHSHIDHFGGVQAIVSEEDLREGRIQIIAPQGFVHEATSENVLAGIAMGRRATFMYGMHLERGARGHVDSGLGKEPARGEFGILVPTISVDRTPQKMEIDGVRFIFQYAPESEAPAELTFYLPDHKAYCGAELVSHTMHNLYTLRGAKVRDALKWSGYIHEVIDLFGDAEAVFASHHWPTWGNEHVIPYLEKQRDTYKFIHDQTLRLANAGYTPNEIADQLELPTELRRSFPDRGYYGTVSHNSKAVYQWYFGWFDGNPAHLDPLPPERASRKYVEFMGGPSEVMRKAQESYDEGEYRWTATVLNHLVFAEPDHDEARELLAKSYDQLAYRAEAAPWRDVYLSGAWELRHGPGPSAMDLKTAAALLRKMPVHRLFDAMAARIHPDKAEGEDLTINFIFTDLDESFVLRVKNSVLNYRKRAPDPEAHATFRVTRELWLRLATRQAGLRELIFSNDVDIDGSRLKLFSFFGMLDPPVGDFNIVTP